MFGGLAVEVGIAPMPLAALDGADGLDAYLALIPQAACRLAPGAALVVEAQKVGERPDPGFDGEG